MDVSIISVGAPEREVRRLTRRWGFPPGKPDSSDPYLLEWTGERLQLKKQSEPVLGPVYADFTDPTSLYRVRHGGGRRQAIARAVGVKGSASLRIVDATAGLGRDAFVLASLGCRVHLLERSKIVAALLEDGLRRAKPDPEIGSWVAERISFICADACQELARLAFSPDVVYLDPMYPPRPKSSLVKKEMRIFQELLGHDRDAGSLLEAALDSACQRVVVKRPAWADPLAGRVPQAEVKTKNHRFDIYLLNRRRGSLKPSSP